MKKIVNLNNTPGRFILSSSEFKAVKVILTGANEFQIKEWVLLIKSTSTSLKYFVVEKEFFFDVTSSNSIYYQKSFNDYMTKDINYLKLTLADANF